MKTATDKFKAAIHKRNRAFKFKLDFGDFTISSLDNFKTESISCGSAGLTFGTVAIGNGTLKGRKLGHTVNGKSFSAYIGLDIDGVTEYVKIGKYTVYNEEVKGIETTAEFQDDIAKLDVDFAATLTYPAVATDVLSYIETTCGVVFDKSNIPSALKVNKALTGYSCRDVVGFIAQLVGCFACVDSATDKIAFKWYTDTGYTFDSDNYLYMIKEPVKGDEFELSLISCDADGEALSQGTGTGVVHIVNPIMTDSILQTVYTARAGFSYNEGNIQFVLGNPLLDIWDIVTATYNGVTTKIPCMNIKTTFNGGFQSDISAYVRNKNSAFEGKMTKELGKLKTEITVIEGSVSSKVSKGDVISEINQSPEAVTIKASKINLKGAVTADAIAANAITSDKIKSGAVTAEKIDVDDLFAENISFTGIMTGNPKTVDSDSFKMIFDGANSCIKIVHAETGAEVLTISPESGITIGRWMSTAGLKVGGVQIGRYGLDYEGDGVSIDVNNNGNLTLWYYDSMATITNQVSLIDIFADFDSTKGTVQSQIESASVGGGLTEYTEDEIQALWDKVFSS